MEDADASAVERIRAGDKDAFRILVDRHSRSVFRYAYRMTGNEFDAEDVVQETFLRAYRQLDHYESRSSFSTWIYRIATNYALDLLRSRKRRDGNSQVTESMAASDPGPDRACYNGQIRVRLTAALSMLSEQERTAFLLRHFEGQSIEEIGSVLGTATSATKNSIFRAVRKVREALEPALEGANATRHR